MQLKAFAFAVLVSVLLVRSQFQFRNPFGGFLPLPFAQPQQTSSPIIQSGFWKGLTEEERDVTIKLVDKKDLIQRKVQNIQNGVATRTRSSDPFVAKLIIDHTNQMMELVKRKAVILEHDEFFVRLEDHRNGMQAKVQLIRGGIEVFHTSTDPCGIAFIQEHAKGVNDVIRNGMEEVRKSHPAPACDRARRNSGRSTVRRRGRRRRVFG